MELAALQSLKDDLARARLEAQHATTDLLALQASFDEMIQRLHREHIAREDIQAAQHRNIQAGVLAVGGETEREPHSDWVQHDELRAGGMEELGEQLGGVALA